MAEASADLLGIEIGGTKLQVVAGNANGRIARRWRAQADRAGGGPAICRQLLEGIDSVGAVGGLAAAIAVGFGGPVDHAMGRIARSHQIEGWENFPLRQWLNDQTGVPVVIENDSNLAAYAEALLGAGASFDPVFYFNLGSGVGGGFVIDKRIYHGVAPGEAEFGHLRLDRSGATVESRCSGWAIDGRIRELTRTAPNSFLARSLATAPGGESRKMLAALAINDTAAHSILGELAEDLAFALSHVVHLLHPAVLVMGGGLAQMGEPLRTAVAARLPKQVMKAFHPPPMLQLAVLGEDAVPVGALMLASTML